VWLYRIATNVCLDALRRRKRLRWERWESFAGALRPRRPRLSARDTPERAVLHAASAASAEEVQLILVRIHAKERACLVLREYGGLSYEEIAEVLATTRAAVPSLLFRAREELGRVCATVERSPARAA
jgi:RNA polymerase sigma-70 factor (ECF subfamily)